MANVKISQLTAGAPAVATDTFPAQRGAGNVSLTVLDLQQAPFTTKTVSATSYTILTSDAGKLLLFTAATAVAVTVPAGLGAGFQCSWKQKGAGQLTFGASGVTLDSFQSLVKSGGQHAVGGIIAEAANVLTLTGNLVS